MLLLLASLAFAELPLPSYEDELSRIAEREISRLMERGEVDEALAVAARFRTHVTDTAHVAYLEGLIHNRSGSLDAAEAAYRRSLRLRQDLPEAWYDLGEILLVKGEYAEAAECFSQSSALYPSGPESWRSPLREAEAAGHLRHPEDFERHLKRALERGFSFREIEGLPQWQTFYADPLLKDPLTKLVTVYGRPETLHSLIPVERRPEETP
ncbi:MAG: tetratricopeptide repeat protein [Deltaproteobacteria bacterium]|nr:MAG: tetratricopeptide repeat protein [Deltaproteobacteria bacterium]